MRNASRFPSRLCLIVAVIVTAIEPLSPVATAQRRQPDAGLQQQRDRLIHQFQTFVQKLVVELQNQGVNQGLAELTVWLEPVNQRFLMDSALSRRVQPEIPETLPAVQRDWRVRLRKRREDVASELYVLSRRAVRSQAPAFAWQLIHDVLWFDPDHRNARHLLGYQLYEDEWVTPFEAKMRRSNPPHVWHDRFGWLPASHVERYENGQRQFNSRWLPADVEAERRRAFRFAWEIETDHFLVRTNVSHERGVELAVMLEGFHDWFKRSFPELFTSPEQLNEMLVRGAGRRGPVRRPPFKVHFYRTKDEYVARLIRKNPQIEITNGIYMPDERIAHFFYDTETDAQSSLYHEATHQMLFELQAVPHQVGDAAHFWVIEGFACYMESFRQNGEKPVVGTPSNPRFYWAKRRLVEENFYTPLGLLTRLGRSRFQSSAELRELYSQSSGLTHFFLHYEDGVYRNALVEFIADIYGPQPRRGTTPGLDQYTGVAFSDLDQQYRSYITELDTD
ncbi:MAG: hypothetical protein ACYTGL_22255 [Planctomycetota bacterium]|jgi:hypothetical protein